MYRELTAADLKSYLGVSDDYHVDALLTFGAYSKAQPWSAFENALGEFGMPLVFEKINNDFFGDIKSIVTANGRLWFEVIYGCAYASEVVHIASLLGAKAVVHLGSFGALQKNIKSGDIIIPNKAYGEESVTRMYVRKNTPRFFSADVQLRTELFQALEKQNTDSSVISIQAMLAETRDDVAAWKKRGYTGVEMECAGLFAVAEHFNVPVAAALYAADNLDQDILVTDALFEETSHVRNFSEHRLYLAAIQTLLGRMKK